MEQMHQEGIIFMHDSSWNFKMIVMNEGIIFVGVFCNILMHFFVFISELVSVIKNAIQQGGMLSLWHGLGPTLLRDVPFSGWDCINQ